MSYVYVITREMQILGVSAKKYGIYMWARNKTDAEKADVFITRYGDEDSHYRHKNPVRFSLQDYLEDPNKQHR